MDSKYNIIIKILAMLYVLSICAVQAFGQPLFQKQNSVPIDEIGFKYSIANLNKSTFKMEFELEGSSIQEGAVQIVLDVDEAWVNDSSFNKTFRIKKVKSGYQLARLIKNVEDRIFIVEIKVPHEGSVALNRKITADLSIYRQKQQLFQQQISIWVFRKLDPPSNGEIIVSSPFGFRTHPVTGIERNFHQGVDIAYPIATRIYSSWDGVIQDVGFDGFLGKYVKVRHTLGGDNYFFIYGHASKYFVSPGDYVKKGDLLLLTGATGRVTGPHLHFQVNHHGIALDPERSTRFRQ